ncbi:MAG TPA: DUF5053 domain-containing protein [Arachidicoccus sp.]
MAVLKLLKQKEIELKTELDKLKKHIGKSGSGLDKQVEVIKKNFNSAKDKIAIDKFIKKEMSNVAAHADSVINELSLKEQLNEVSEIVSMSYIAKKYFGKTSQWLYARINGNLVNGKPGALKPEEVKILNSAFKDISKKIGSTKVSLTNV